MATNLDLDDRLVAKALRLGKHRTKKASVTTVLEEYVNHLEQEKVIPLFGTVQYDPGYDAGKQRTRR